MSDRNTPASRDERLRALQALTDSALSQLNADDLLEALLDRVVPIVDADTATLLLLETGTGRLAARASRGIEEEVRQGVRIPLGVGFAGRIAADRVPVRLDRVDPTTVTNPILWEEGIQAMLGVPLLASGELVGVLHVGRRRAQPFSAGDEEILVVAADRVASAVQSEQRHLHQVALVELIEKLRPTSAPDCPGLEIATRYLPAGHGRAGGDWYDLFLGDAGQLWIAIGDVAGHGLEAAIAMTRAQATLRAYAVIENDPEAVLERADRALRMFAPGVLVTALAAVTSPPYRHLRIATAGHPLPVIADLDRPAEVVTLPIGRPLGVGPGARRTSRTLPFPRGAVAVFYTDGLIERRGEPIDRSLEQLRSHVHPTSADVLCREILRRHVGHQALRDDAALVAIRALPD